MSNQRKTNSFFHARTLRKPVPFGPSSRKDPGKNKTALFVEWLAFAWLCLILFASPTTWFEAGNLAWAKGQYDINSAWAPESPGQTDSAQQKDRFVDNDDGTVTDTMTNLMWMKNGRRFNFLAAVTWQEAQKKVERLEYNGLKGWRLPTIDEWKTLIDNTKERPALVEPNPFENMVVHMPYWSATEFVFGPNYTCVTICPIRAYTVSLWRGAIGSQNKNRRAFVLPVRSLDG